MENIIKHEPKWLYRLESKTPNNGLWYNSDNEYVWGCRNCSGTAKDLPMPYDKRYHVNGFNWFSACSTKEDLLHWYSLEDANYLVANGFVFTKYLACDYIEYDTHETVFLKESIMDRVEIDINELFTQRTINIEIQDSPYSSSGAIIKVDGKTLHSPQLDSNKRINQLLQSAMALLWLSGLTRIDILRYHINDFEKLGWGDGADDYEHDKQGEA